MPVRLQFKRASTESCWKAVGVPHSGGRLPDNLFTSKSSSDWKDPLLPQLTGSVPCIGAPVTCKTSKAGKAPAAAQVDGMVPV